MFQLKNFIQNSRAGVVKHTHSKSTLKSEGGGGLTFLLLSQMFHDNKSQHSSGHQSHQDPQNYSHYVVVADPHHNADIINLTVDRYLEVSTVRIFQGH